MPSTLSRCGLPFAMMALGQVMARDAIHDGKIVLGLSERLE
jgi:hypothetical protein